MSRINHGNIDKWLFDHVEGNLSPSQQRELNSFLLEHPEYELDLDAWKQSHISTKEEQIPVLAYESELLAIAEPFAWKRYAAVAALALLIGGGSILLLNQNESTSENHTATLVNGSTSRFTAMIPNAATGNSIVLNSIVSVGNEQNTATTSPSFQTEATAISATSLPDRNRNQVRATQTSTVVFANSTRTPLSLNSTSEEQIAFASNEQALEQENTTLATNENRESNTETAIASANELPKLVHVFDAYRPELVSEAYGNTAAVTAIDILKGQPVDLNNPGTPLASNEVRDNGVSQPRRKKFHDNRLGFYNGRDHLLLQPNNIATAEYAAFASTSVSPSLSLGYRNQWSDADHSVNNARVFYSQFNKKMKSAWGIGMNAISANNGGYTGFTGSFLFSPKFRINKNFSIEPGVMANIYQNDIHADKLHSGSRIEPVRGVFGMPLNGEGMPKTQRGFDVHFSTLVQTKYFYSAIGIDNMLHPALGVRQNDMGGVSSTPTRFKAVVGTDFKRLYESKLVLSPQVSFMRQGQVNELWAGFNARYQWMSLGAAAAPNGQVLATAGIQTGRLRLLYQFDVTKSYLNQTYYGSHEVSMRLSLNGLGKKQSVILNSPK